ncbi:MAG TPA: hypothetical protein VN618_01710 [Solirubrobacteraceae bacterium]|nr:hypothetical protein [Solirubrobacteraceae bacterium]
MTPDGIYRHDPLAAPDREFEPGTLAHLVPGNTGRMLDPRRTPVTILDLDSALGTFELRVEDFEDRGALWRLPAEDVSSFQFARGSRRAGARAVEGLERVVASFAGTLEIAADPDAAAETERALAAERARIAPLLERRPGLRDIDLADCAARREGSPEATAAIGELLRDAGLAGLEREFAGTHVSNPASGEVVKGHAIVLAEMGLCPFAGRPVRDPALFDGERGRAERRAHILLRLAFLAELTALLGVERVDLHRGTASREPLRPARRSSFVAASFSREVALAHLRSEAEFTSIACGSVPVSRLFMTFLETPEMNAPYREAEALLIARPGADPF